MRPVLVLVAVLCTVALFGAEAPQQRKAPPAMTVPGTSPDAGRERLWDWEEVLSQPERDLIRMLRRHKMTPDYYESFWISGGSWHPKKWHRDPKTLLKVYRPGPRRVPMLDLGYEGPSYTWDWASVKEPPPGVPLNEEGRRIYEIAQAKLGAYWKAEQEKYRKAGRQRHKKEMRAGRRFLQ